MFALALLLPLTLPTAAETPEGTASAVAEIVRIGREDPRVRELLHELTREHPRRLTGSKGLADATAWAMDRFRALGLEPRFEPWGEVSVGFERGPAWGRVVYPDPRPLAFLTHAWTPGTGRAARGMAVLEPRDGVPLEEAHDGLLARWVLLRAESTSGRRRRAVVRACEEAGALGVLLAGPEDGRLVTSGRMNADDDAEEGICRVVLRRDQHAELEDRLACGARVQLEFDVDVGFTPGPVAAGNVVCDLAGRERPDEFVIVQAHLDAWDGAQGAQDDGTGVATTLEAARLLVAAGVRPRRTVRFVLYSGEEQGLHGSVGYVRDHADELESISLVLNHDQGTNFLSGIHATEAMLPAFEEVFDPVQDLDPERPFELVPVDGLRGGASDHAPFVAAGVPAFHWRQSREGYRFVHHTQHDVFEHVDLDDVRHSALVVAIAAYGFAEREDPVDRRLLRAPDPRRMGVYLEDTRIAGVSPRGRAAAAGWEEGDVVLSVDGDPVSTGDELVERLQRGGPEKGIVLRRGEERIETVLDWSDDPGEARRREHREQLRALRSERAAREVPAGERPPPDSAADGR